MAVPVYKLFVGIQVALVVVLFGENVPATVLVQTMPVAPVKLPANCAAVPCGTKVWFGPALAVGNALTVIVAVAVDVLHRFDSITL